MFIVLSLFALYLFAVGSAAASFLKTRGGLFEQLALTLGIGALINYCLVLSGQPLWRVFIVGAILAAYGVVRISRDLRSDPERQVGRPAMILFSLACLLYLVAAYYFLILSEPLFRWDARSVWFFKARMVWAEGALNQHAGWTHPSVAFSTPDYPNLIPVIAAQLAYLKGYWNEFFPKGSLLVMLVPLLLWVFSFRRARPSFVLLLLVSFFSLGAWLSNGYMDGYLALYGGVALLTFGRYLADARDTDLYSGICALGIAAGLKNEGLLLGACVIVALLLVSLPATPGIRALWRRVRDEPLLSRVVLISIAPTIVWTGYKIAWGLRDAMTAEPMTGLSRLATRAADGFSPGYILTFMAARATAFWMLLALVVLAGAFSVWRGVTIHRGALLATGTAALYFGGLYLAYLSSPADLYFHLSTSATRTVTGAGMALMVGLFFLLSGLEKDEAAR
ncbi:MAG TPA: hypothetical protein VK886_09610 [Vicinamibacterales bacterium]|nr:hypothetical protein [Vicinamibacterales bacterium]